MRQISERELIHERLGAEFARALSMYDTTRRLEVLIGEFLPNNLRGKRVLEVGTGLGFFAEQLVKRGASLTVLDIGETLVRGVADKLNCEGRCADALSLTTEFPEPVFDVVLSSECIEHTPDPDLAVRQMMAVLKPGGLLSLSTPNKVWYPVVLLATKLKARPFDGFENFSSFGSLRHSIEAGGGTVLREKGLHLFPFQFGMHGFSEFLDNRAQVARDLMINLCVLAQKKSK